MNKIHFQITTPERVVLQDDIDSVTLMTQAGEITVLPNHAPLISSLKAGELKLKNDGQESFMAVTGGFLQVQAKSRVVVLADSAERAEEISEEKAEEARLRAQAILEEKKLDKAELASAAAVLEKSLTQLKVARRRRR